MYKRRGTFGFWGKRIEEEILRENWEKIKGAGKRVGKP
ncbi:hypothetical protein SLEP1_g33852 [Rubroshorea leprosula]|uniref:Uncharacterized protein n=1 Tax=Rubroshorea leprosula TaxID=152421 RepID=A0AAV5KI55_9ROSI|nr:hypothetical protein SLEP1_g33852 [Rubroshorea leprosula]